MNSALLVILIVVTIIIVVLFGEAIVEFLTPIWFALMCIVGAAGTCGGLFLLVRSVMANDGELAVYGCILTLVGGVIFIFCLMAALDFLGRRKR